MDAPAPDPSTADHPTADHPSLRSVLAIVAVIGVVAAVAVGATRWRDQRQQDEAAGSTALPPEVAPEMDVTTVDSYEWSPVPIGGGGFVTGIVGATSDGSSVLYARTDVGGAHRWDATTGTWEQMIVAGSLVDGELTEGDYSVASIAVSASDPDVVAVAVGDDYNPEPGQDPETTGRVLWSDDGGATWRSSTERWSIAGNQSFRVGRERLAIDPTDPRRALLGTQREGLWSTDDAGETWREVPADEVPHGVTDTPEDDQTGVSTVSFVAARDATEPSVAVVGVTGDGLYATDDVEGSWRRIVELDAGDVPSSAEVAGDEVVLSVDTPGRDDARLVRLAPVGAGPVADITAEDLTTPARSSTWIVGVAPDVGGATSMVLSDGAVRDGHLWTSDDDGATWRQHDVEIDAGNTPWLGETDLDQYMSTGRFLFDPVTPDRVWFAEGMGVWRTDDLDADTVTWTSVSAGIEEVVVSDIVVPPGGSPIVTVADRQGFLLPELGVPPTRPLVDERFSSGPGVDFSGGSPDHLAWIGAQSNLPPEEAQPRGATSTDGGVTWQEMSGMVPDMYGGEVAVSAVDSARMVWLPAQRGGLSAEGLFVSGDAGRTWSTVAPGTEMDSLHQNVWWFGRRALAADRIDAAMYLMGDDAQLRVSRDGGQEWAAADFAPPCSRDSDCHVYGQVRADPGAAGHLWATTGTGGLFHSTDAGASPWRQVGDFDEARAFGFGAPVGRAEHPAVYVWGRAAGRAGVWRSVDGGGRWELLSEHPGGIAAKVHVVTGDPNVPGRVYVGFAGVGAVRGDPATG